MGNWVGRGAGIVFVLSSSGFEIQTFYIDRDNARPDTYWRRDDWLTPNPPADPSGGTREFMVGVSGACREPLD
jgi:hypothetical protein